MLNLKLTDRAPAESGRSRRPPRTDPARGGSRLARSTRWRSAPRVPQWGCRSRRPARGSRSRGRWPPTAAAGTGERLNVSVSLILIVEDGQGNVIGMNNMSEQEIKIDR